MSLSNAAEIELAQQIQRSFAKRNAKSLIHNLRYAARSISARTLTGDYYDFLPLGPGRLVFVVADISGKGMAAALLMASLRAFIISQERRAFDDLPGVVHKAHQLFYESSPPDQFASLFLGDYEERDGRLTYLNCGHVPPLLLRGNGSEEKLESTAPVIGMLKSWNATTKKVELTAADTLIMFTDGVTEATNLAGEQFGYDRLTGVFRDSSRKEPASIADAVIRAVTTFAGFNRQDDLTAVVVQVR
jgi:serine phosphatase RsbU (regulator of sigma subunit)